MITIELAIFTVGLLGILFAAIWFLRNIAAGIMWSISVLVLLFVQAFNIGIEYFWITLMATVILLIAGMVVRWNA